MLFNSFEFLLIFLPIVLSLFFLLKLTKNTNLQIIFLIFISIIFYGYAKFDYIFLILVSIITNFSISLILHKNFYKKLFLYFGIIFNLSLLSYYKYSLFILEDILNLDINGNNLKNLILPIGISFYTFQQIAFLVDTYKQETHEKSLKFYTIFVCFFPQLIAGPIVRYQEIKEQFYNINKNRNNLWRDLSCGIILITIGLFKKVILSEQMGYWADRTFFLVSYQENVTFIEAWLGILCFSFQIYFDFSAYSDIAIGLGLLIGIKLPVNFNSPYKSESIIDFWRTWHITLSNFLKIYIYIPLGGNSSGNYNKYIFLIIVMFVGGVWHGAGWTFILWGFFHGVLLVINHFWRDVKLRNNFEAIQFSFIFKFSTFILVSLGWVLFRSPDLDSALRMYEGLFLLNGFYLPTHYESFFGEFNLILNEIGIKFGTLKSYGGGSQIIWVFCMLVFVWYLPNSNKIWKFLYNNQSVKFSKKISLNKVLNSSNIINKISYFLGAVVALTLFFILIKIIQGKQGEFIYFQF